MIRIRFTTDQDRIRGNYLLATTTGGKRLRGQIFEISERARQILDDQQIPYVVLPSPEPPTPDPEVRDPYSVEIQRQNCD